MLRVYSALSRNNVIKVCIAVLTVFVILSLPPRKVPAIVQKPNYGIITMFSENHICEAIHSCRTYANISEVKDKSVTIIGLYAPDVSAKKLAAYHKNCPFVELHPFSMDRFPAEFKNFRNYRFKFPTVVSVLPEFTTIMYIDASVRFQAMENETLTDLFNSMESSFAPQGIRLLTSSMHSNFPVIHPDMYAFFNVTVNQTKETTQYQSGTYMLNNSPEGWNIVDKVVQCAMEPKCMAPKGAKQQCHFKPMLNNDRVICHRFDQSALNMRLIELYGTNQSLYYQPSSMINVVRMGRCKIDK